MTYQTARRRSRLSAALAKPGQNRSGVPPLGTYGRWVTRGSGLTGDARARAAQSVAPMAGGMLVGAIGSSIGFLFPVGALISEGHFGVAALFGAIAAGMVGMFTGMPVVIARRWMTSPITDEEMASLAVARQDNLLQQAYTRLVREVISHPRIPDDAQDGLRDALRALGEAMSQLSGGAGAAPVVPTELRASADAVRARSDAETDPVTQASLARQADAMERTASAAERSAVLIKRANALHDELAAQIESLRLGLTAFYDGNADMPGLAALSESVRAVAAESVSVVSARAELDTASARRTPPAPQVQTLGQTR